ncbi:hypothetical protein B0H34DRAFT_701977 [Crassisporium funariophilum]|nr:hypothetical protein B0H34DRAFT_701977 [Crassisporium funariophilum]
MSSLDSLLETSFVTSDSEASSTQVEPVCCPVLTCHLHGDLVLQASDGVQFLAHKINLQTYSQVFAPSAALEASEDEVVHLTESSSVLRLILQYMHNIRQPDLRGLPFSTLEALSEAVEKYIIYSAMEVCNTRMEQAVIEHPLEVYIYASKHGYSELVDKAAPLMIKLPLGEVIQTTSRAGLELICLLKFVRYRVLWEDVFKSSVLDNLPVVLHKGGYAECAKWPDFYHAVVMKAALNLDALRRFGEITDSAKYHITGCEHCTIRLSQWTVKVSGSIKSLPLYSCVDM